MHKRRVKGSGRRGSKKSKKLSIIHKINKVPDQSSEHSNGKKVQQQMENACRFHIFKPRLPKRSISLIEHRQINRASDTRH